LHAHRNTVSAHELILRVVPLGAGANKGKLIVKLSEEPAQFEQARL
jgi:hypothetical protein